MSSKYIYIKLIPTESVKMKIIFSRLELYKKYTIEENQFGSFAVIHNNVTLCFIDYKELKKYFIEEIMYTKLKLDKLLELNGKEEKI